MVMRSSHVTIEHLIARGLVPADRQEALQRVEQRYAVAVTEEIAQAIKGGEEDPLARQFIPDAQELNRTEEELTDPIADRPFSPVPGIVHRHPDRVLLKATTLCPVYCRFCFRREMIGPKQDALSHEELAAALDYIAAHGEIWEVILTGGDPLILSPRRLEHLIDGLAACTHLGVLRLHSRVPTVSPGRITDRLIDTLRQWPRQLWLAVHVNHANELTDQALAALDRLRRSGIGLVSQTVLLKGINDDVETLETLFRRLVAAGVKPYYLHHPDLAPGTGHFRLPPETGLALMAALGQRVSGLCLPSYVIDPPDGSGKRPVADWLATRPGPDSG